MAVVERLVEDLLLDVRFRRREKYCHNGAWPSPTIHGVGLPGFTTAVMAPSGGPLKMAVCRPEAWNTVLDDWRSHEGKKPKQPADRLHVETHILEGRDVFITNERGLLAMCRRLRDEHAFAVDAMSVRLRSDTQAREGAGAMIRAFACYDGLALAAWPSPLKWPLARTRATRSRLAS
jgi:hypothetical protein